MIQNGLINNKYTVDRIEVTVEQDRKNTIDVLRPTQVEIETDAPDKDKAETWLLNKIAENEYSNADRSGEYLSEAAQDISDITGVSVDSIEIL